MTDRVHHGTVDDALHALDLVRRKALDRQALVDEQLPRLSCTESSPDQSVTVAVNAEGMLTGLVLSPKAAAHSPEELSRHIMRAYDTAQQRAARQAEILLAPAFGDESRTVQRYRARIEPPPADSRYKPPAGRLAAQEATDDDSEFDFMTMRD